MALRVMQIAYALVILAMFAECAGPSPKVQTPQAQPRCNTYDSWMCETTIEVAYD